MAADDAERTEAPTPKRIDEARRRGEVARSQDLSGVIVLLGTWLALAAFAAERLIGELAQQARTAWSGAEIHPHTLADFHSLLLHHGTSAMRGFLPLALLMMAAGATASLTQTGVMFSSEALAFRGERLNPLTGLKRLVSPERLFDLAKAPLKIAVVATAVWIALSSTLREVMALLASDVVETPRLLEDLAAVVVGLALTGLGLLAVLDLLWVRQRHFKRLRMTIREVREEAREREGSPQVRSRRRQIQRDLSRQRMIAEVATADVVVANPVHYAIALRYVRAEMSAPKVVARGRNRVAERIRAEARRNDVPIVENPPLARVLFAATRVGREVPEHLFQAVAEVLAHVYRIDRRRASSWRSET